MFKISFTKSDIEIIQKYFTDFSTALNVILRLYKGRLSSYWGGIDTYGVSTILYFTQDGLVVRILSKKPDLTVKINFNEKFETLLISKWHNIYAKKDDAIKFSIIAKHLIGNGQIYVGMNDNDFMKVAPEQMGTSFLVLAPKINLSSCPDMTIQPPWLVSIIAARTGLGALDGLDTDPYIAAKGVADTIARESGALDEEPKYKYKRAREQLISAIESTNALNENAIHKVIKMFPWILVEAVDYIQVFSERSLNYNETQGEDGAVTDQKRTIRPDFIYECYDNCFLIVELEASTKKIFKKSTETTYQLPTSAAIATNFQISNYKQICSGKFGSQILRELGKPDSWNFRYLLVIGSSRQADFDLRSWNNLSEIFADIGIEMRNWDYYINRLERFEAAATVSQIIE